MIFRKSAVLHALSAIIALSIGLLVYLFDRQPDRVKAVFLILALSLMTVAPGVEAVKLWKWVDKDGKVTYSESSPPSPATKAEAKQVDPDQNVIHADLPPLAPSAPAALPPPDSGGGQTTLPDSRVRRGIAAGAAASTVPLPPPPTPPPPPMVTPPPAGH